MKITFYKITAFICLFVTSHIHANDLSSFGIESIESVSESYGNTVRGQGAFTTSMSAYQIFAFDPASGTSINLQSTNISTADDYIFMSSTSDSGTFALSDSNVGMSDLTLTINEFQMEIVNFNLGSMGTALTENLFIQTPLVD